MENITVNTKLNAYEFIAVAEEIADGYFDETGRYQPHIGLLNAMRIFNNVCIKDKSGKQVGAATLEDVNAIVADKTFLDAFDVAYYSDDPLTFGYAVKAAKEIVGDRLSSVDRISTAIQNAISAAITTIQSSIKPEDIDEVINVSKKIAGDGNYVDNILKAYTDSKAYREIVTQEAQGDVK